MNTPSAQFEDIQILEQKLTSSQLPTNLQQKVKAMIERLNRIASSQGYSEEYDSVARYLDWIVNLPWSQSSKDILSLENAKKILDKNHFGLGELKERILEYISVTALKQQQGKKTKAPTILLLGLVGTGKTTMAISIAEALGRKFGRIPFGGMGDALQLRGKARAYPGSEPGQVIKVLRRVQTKNPVILLDEVDRVADESRADIMGVLVELLDPEQNDKFLDHFIDYPFDLSEVLFIATAHNTRGIATAVLDRVELVEMPSYTDDQKITIGKNYLLPRALASSGLATGELMIDDDIWDQIVRPLGFDAGMRTLDRTINAICRKVAKQKLEGKIHKVAVTTENLKEYLPN